MIYMKASYLKHHLGSLKTPKWFSNWMNTLKQNAHPRTYQEKFHNILRRHSDHLYVFTDGSKDNDKTACAAVLNKTITKKALPTESSIFTTEALDIISKSKQEIYLILRLALSLTNTKQ